MYAISFTCYELSLLRPSQILAHQSNFYILQHRQVLRIISKSFMLHSFLMSCHLFCHLVAPLYSKEQFFKWML